MVGIEFRVDFIRQQLHGDGKVKQGVIPDHGIHMIDLLNFCLQGSYILVRHILHDNEGKSALPKILHEFILPDGGIHILRQVIQHVIIDSGICNANHCRNHQQNG